MSSYTVTLIEDENGDLILPLPEELTTGDYPWLPGDDVTWEVKEDGTAILTNVSWLMRNENGFG